MSVCDPVLDMTVREFLERATRQIVAASTTEPLFDRRIDVMYDVVFEDPKSYLMSGRRHRVRTRLKVTCASLGPVENEAG